MTDGGKIRLPLVSQTVPGRKFRIARRLTQTLALVAIVVAPVLGGWQRLDRNALAAWEGHGWDLPGPVMDVLPLGEAPARAHQANQLVGGGSAVEYVGVPIVDPVAGALVLLTSSFTTKLLIAWSLPVLLGLLAGRAFCGWFCPFGTLSRAVASLLRALPFRPPAWRIPERRPFGLLLLGGAAVAGLAGAHGLLYLFLPYAALEQSAYALWLMGGAGAALGWVLGLLAAGIAFGPTVYCAALCPTGAALSLVGRRRVVRVAIAEPARCGAHCTLCSRACWLGLDPASGDPGPHCDGCARCFTVCPRTNLRIGLLPRRAGRGAANKRGLAIAAILLSFFVAADAPAAGPKPRLLLEARTEREGVTAAISLVDLGGVRLDPDAPDELSVVRLTVAVARGERRAPDALGRLSPRETYTGPLTLDFFCEAGEPLGRAAFDSARAPRSTPRRALYRADLKVEIAPGDRIVLHSVPGFIETPIEWVVPEQNPSGWERTGSSALAAFLLFSGLFALALATGRGVEPPARKISAKVTARRHSASVAEPLARKSGFE